jgi:two-component system, cell cycle response regulator CtrA
VSVVTRQADPVRERYITALEDENETLRERVRKLEEALGWRMTIPVIFGLSPHESRLFGGLLARDIMSKAQILDALYGHLPGDDEPEIKIVDVFVCKARAKLKPFGVEISTKWGNGYYLTKEAKAKVAEYLATEVGNG